MEDNYIIAKVDEPTEWIRNIVIVEKCNKKLRVCLDPCHLNKYLCTEQYPIPIVEELAAKVWGKTVFSAVDMKEGFFANGIR